MIGQVRSEAPRTERRASARQEHAIDAWPVSVLFAGHAGGLILYRPAVGVCELSDNNHDEVNQSPYAKTAKRKELYNTCAGFSYIKPVHAQAPQKEAEQECWNKTP